MIEPAPSRVAVVAARLGCTEGQLYTMAIGLTLSLLLAVPGIPAVLRDRPVSEQAGSVLRPFDDGVDDDSAAPTTAPPLPPPPPSEVAPLGPPRRVTGPGRATGPGAVVLPPSGGAAPAPAPGSIRTFARVGPPGVPGGVAVAPDRTVFVTTDNGSARGGTGPSHVFAYTPEGVPARQYVVTGQREDRTGGLAGVVVHPRGDHVAVLDPEGERVLRIDVESGAQSDLAQIPDLPPCLVPLPGGLCQPGLPDRPPRPVAAAYDAHGNLLVADPAQDTIWRIGPSGGAPVVWYQSAYFSSGDGPNGLAVDGASVVLTVGATSDPSALGAGALYRLAANADGSAGALALVHAFGDGDRPGALAVARSGTAYVVLRNSGAVVSLARDGMESGRIEPPGTGTVPLDSPSAVALVPGALLVANGRASADASRWAILAVAVDDSPTLGAAGYHDG